MEKHILSNAFSKQRHGRTLHPAENGGTNAMHIFMKIKGIIDWERIAMQMWRVFHSKFCDSIEGEMSASWSLGGWTPCRSIFREGACAWAPFDDEKHFCTNF